MLRIPAGHARGPLRHSDPPPAAEESIEAGEDAGTLGVGDLLGTAVRLATHVPAVARAGGKLAGELAKVGIGRSDIAAPSGDWRFTDPTWTENPAYLRLIRATWLSARRSTNSSRMPSCPTGGSASGPSTWSL